MKAILALKRVGGFAPSFAAWFRARSFLLFCCLIWFDNRSGGIKAFRSESPGRAGVGHTQGSQERGQSYRYLDYAGTRDALIRLAKMAPQLVTVSTAQKEWGVSSPGACSKDGRVACEQWFARISSRQPIPDGNSENLTGDDSTPEVFFSGSLHGNERVGPTATVEFARLLVENYIGTGKSSQVTGGEYSMTADLSRWLRMLVDTRAIYIMPNANALGYYQNVREENGIDPNRDFPYGKDPEECMQTTAARAINEIYRAHLFQLAITFHGGMRAISYEWGSPNAQEGGSDFSPDDGALLPLGEALVQAAGSNRYYPAGALNPLVYPVSGGMEDWAYAGSWDVSGYAKPCHPKTTFGASGENSYPEERTTYTKNPDELRAFNILVETADDKAPVENTLGRTDAVLWRVGGDGGGRESTEEHLLDGDGHIPRNVRLMIFMTDLVQPYVLWRDEPIKLRLAWDVGGALAVDETAVFFVTGSGDGDGNYAFNDMATCQARLSGQSVPVDRILKDGIRVNPSVEGRGGGSVWRWMNVAESGEDPNGESTPNPSDNKGDVLPLLDFRGRFSVHAADAISALERGGVITGKENPIAVAYAVAKVDQGWSTPTRGAWPKGEGPISHVVNARTKDGYRARNGLHVILGQIWWASKPRCIDVDAMTGMRKSLENKSTRKPTAVSGALLRGRAQ